MAGLSDTTLIDANGIGTLQLSNPSTTHGLRIESLAVLISEEDGIPEARIYAGQPSGPTQLALSGGGRDDVAVGPYFLPPGGFVTVQWTDATPGLKAQAWLVASPIEIAPLRHGTFRFGIPTGTQGVRLIHEITTTTDLLAINAAESITYFPPTENRVWRVIAARLRLLPPLAGTAGTHSWIFTQGTTINVARGIGNWNAGIEYNRSQWENTTTGNPVPEALLLALQSLRADLSFGITLSYINNTNAIQTATRERQLYLEEHLV